MSLQGITDTFPNVQFIDAQKVRLFTNEKQLRQSEHTSIEQFGKIVTGTSQLEVLIGPCTT